MRPPLEIAGIGLTPRMLFCAYKLAAERARKNKTVWIKLNDETHLPFYLRYAELENKLEVRLDRILQEMEE